MRIKAADDKREFTNGNVGQYFRAFHNFGRPVPDRTWTGFAKRSPHVNLDGLDLQALEKQELFHDRHPYLFLVGSALRACWSQLAYLPRACYAEYLIRKGYEVE